jgi:hypothetical protein
MADLTDVSGCLVNLAETAVYPNGLLNPSVANVDITIFPGWPNPADLDAALAANKCFVSVYPTQRVRNTTRFQNDWVTQSINPQTIVLTVNNNQVTVTGTITTPQTCMVINNDIGYAYSLLSNDSVNSIASSLAGLIPGASSVGNVITITGSHKLEAHISVPGTSIKEVKRQLRVFQITIWAPSTTIRTQVASSIDGLFSDTTRFELPDNFSAWLNYDSDHESDIIEKQLCFRRDLFYQVEYPTTITQTDYTIADPFINSVTPVSSIP